MTTEQIVASVVSAVSAYAPHFAILVGLVVIDLLAGVGAALKVKKFTATQLADFYVSTVAPKVLGWVGVTLGLAVIAPALGSVTEAAPIVAAIGSNGLWATVAVDIVASIVKSLNEIRA